MLYIEAALSPNEIYVISVPGYDHDCGMLFWLRSPVTDWLLEHDGDMPVSRPALLGLVKRLRDRGGCEVKFFTSLKEADHSFPITAHDCVVSALPRLTGWTVYTVDVAPNKAQVPLFEPLCSERTARGRHFSYLRQLYSRVLDFRAGHFNLGERREDAQ